MSKKWTADEVTVPVGVAEMMPGTSGFTMVCFDHASVPVGTPIYTTPPAHAAKDVDYRKALKDLYRGYVVTLEAARDRITGLGGFCDPLDKMEQGDPFLIDARNVLATQPPTTTNVQEGVG